MQRVTPAGASLTSNCVLPQWQLPFSRHDALLINDLDTAEFLTGACCQHHVSSTQPDGIISLGFLFILIVGLLAGTISGIVGTGSSIMLMPVLVYQYGPKQAVPIMAVAAVMANLSRILAWWREVDWRACAAYSVTGIPAAALGARTLLVLPSHAVDVAIGLFLIAMVPVRHWLARHAAEGQPLASRASAAPSSAISPASWSRPGRSACRCSCSTASPRARSSPRKPRVRSGFI